MTVNNKDRKQNTQNKFQVICLIYMTKTIVGLSPKQCGEIRKLLIKHQPTFSELNDNYWRTGIIRHKIPTEMAQPIKQPSRRLPVHMNEEADKQIEDMLKKEVIQPSSSPWATCIVMVQKKDGSKRFSRRL